MNTTAEGGRRKHEKGNDRDNDTDPLVEVEPFSENEQCSQQCENGLGSFDRTGNRYGLMFHGNIGSSGLKRESSTAGRKSALQNTVFKNNMGRTALLLSANFLNTSYMPSRAAEIKARINHITSLFYRKNNSSG